MIFSRMIWVPAGTSRYLPFRTELRVSAGVIDRAWVRWDDGAGYLGGVRLLYHEERLYPRSLDEWLPSFPWPLEWNDEFVLDREPLRLVVEAYNEDDTYDHIVWVQVSVVSGVRAAYVPVSGVGAGAAAGAAAAAAAAAAPAVVPAEAVVVTVTRFVTLVQGVGSYTGCSDTWMASAEIVPPAAPVQWEPRSVTLVQGVSSYTGCSDTWVGYVQVAVMERSAVLTQCEDTFISEVVTAWIPWRLELTKCEDTYLSLWEPMPVKKFATLTQSIDTFLEPIARRRSEAMLAVYNHRKDIRDFYDLNWPNNRDPMARMENWLSITTEAEPRRDIVQYALDKGWIE